MLSAGTCNYLLLHVPATQALPLIKDVSFAKLHFESMLTSRFCPYSFPLVRICSETRTSCSTVLGSRDTLLALWSALEVEKSCSTEPEDVGTTKTDSGLVLIRPGVCHYFFYQNEKHSVGDG
uniref:Uncharacterized protein n=1 Tax=Amblyomma tuberculatum TaxID=48802 RepID=A0A6M2E2T1_9ACAR